MSGGPLPAPVPPAALAYGGSPFFIGAPTDTIPTNFPLVTAQSVVGDITMVGTPVLQPGIYIGQRVTISFIYAPLYIVSFVTAGNVRTLGGAEATRLAPGESIDFVWGGTFWQEYNLDKEVMERHYLGDHVQGNLFPPEGFFLQGGDSVGDPPSGWQFDSTEKFNHDIDMTTGDVTIGSVPSLLPAAQDGQFVMLYNNVVSTFAITFQDESVLPGSGLKLSTPTAKLDPAGLLFLQFKSGYWTEVGRNIKGGGAVTTYTALNTGDTFPLASVVIIHNDNNAGAGGVPTNNYQLPMGTFDGQQMLLVNDAASFDSLYLFDDSTMVGVNGIHMNDSGSYFAAWNGGQPLFTPGSSISLVWFGGGLQQWFETAHSLVA